MFTRRRFAAVVLGALAFPVRFARAAQNRVRGRVVIQTYDQQADGTMVLTDRVEGARLDQRFFDYYQSVVNSHADDPSKCVTIEQFKYHRGGFALLVRSKPVGIADVI